MPEYLLPILLFIIASAGLAVAMLSTGMLLGPKRNSDVKEMPYESGMDPIHDARRRFDVRFHLVAIAFLLFDVELLFLYPWAVANRHPEGLTSLIGDGEGARQAHLLVFGEVLVFLVLLAMGLVYAWRKGVFRWR